MLGFRKFWGYSYEVLFIYEYARKIAFLTNSSAGAAAAGDAVTRVEIMVLKLINVSMQEFMLQLSFKGHFC